MLPILSCINVTLEIKVIMAKRLMWRIFMQIEFAVKEMYVLSVGGGRRRTATTATRARRGAGAEITSATSATGAA